MLENIKWLGHSSFRIITSEGKTIYIDPWKIEADSPKADAIFITHGHYDHLSPEDISKIRDKETEVFCPQDVVSKIGGKIKTVKPGDLIDSKYVRGRVVPAYNTDKDFHPKENRWVGYVLEINDQKIYHAGDTDLIPEMKELKNIDIALLPVSGTYVMNSDEAIEAVKIIKPKYVIPMHYGDEIGTVEDAKKLKGKVDCQVVIMEKEE